MIDWCIDVNEHHVLSTRSKNESIKITYFHRISTYNIERCHWSAQYRIYLFLHISLIVFRWSTSTAPVVRDDFWRIPLDLLKRRTTSKLNNLCTRKVFQHLLSLSHTSHSVQITRKREKGKNTSTNDDDAHFKHTIEIDIVLHTYIHTIYNIQYTIYTTQVQF